MDVKFQPEIVNYCIGCGAEFTDKQPHKDAQDNQITCGDGNSGCGIKFVAKVIEKQ